MDVGDKSKTSNYPVDKILGFVGEQTLFREMMHFVASFPDRICVIFTAKRNLKERVDAGVNSQFLTRLLSIFCTNTFILKRSSIARLQWRRNLIITWPVKIVKRRIPSDQTSTSGPYELRPVISGARLAGVPHKICQQKV